MNPWASATDQRTGDDYGASYAAPYRVSLGGLKAFVTRHQLDGDASGLCLCLDTSAYSSTQLVDKIERLMQLKTTALECVRTLEQTEAQITTGGLLLPRQLQAKSEAVCALRGDLEELLAMKSVLLRTLQKDVASEYLDLEMQHQRTFIDLFLKLSDELPRYATSAVATGSSASSLHGSRGSHGIRGSRGSSQRSVDVDVAHEMRQRHKDYETAVTQCKATIAKFHLIRDDMARVRAAYNQLHESTVNATSTPAYAG